MFTGTLEDRIAIQELHGRYADAVSRNDLDDWAACWADDATWTLMDTTVEGKEAIVQLWNGAMAQFDAVGFIMQAVATELDGDTGTGTCLTQEMLVENGVTRAVAGHYADTFVKQAGEWLYASRDFRAVAQLGPAGE